MSEKNIEDNITPEAQDSGKEKVSAELQASESKTEQAPDIMPEPDDAEPSKPLSPLICIKGKLVESSPQIVLKPRKRLKYVSRRDTILFGAGMLAAGAGYKWLLSDGESGSQDAQGSRSKFLEAINDFDDTVAKSLYSKTELVPTYSKSQLTELPNNYAGSTPGPEYLQTWHLRLSGLASGRDLILSADDLRNDFAHTELISRMVCVEGWSAIAWWGGLKFANLVQKFPPKPGCKWAKLTSDVNLDGDGNSDPYFVSLDIESALHPQTLLATHHNGKILEVEHGAPLRLLAPMKLGLKNIKAITSIAYSVQEPDDYWNKEGYSYYDGI